MEKFFALLKTRIWKTNLDDSSRIEMYNELNHVSLEVCNTLNCLIKRIKQKKIEETKEQASQEYVQKSGTYGEDRF